MRSVSGLLFAKTVTRTPALGCAMIASKLLSKLLMSDGVSVLLALMNTRRE